MLGDKKGYSKQNVRWGVSCYKWCTIEWVIVECCWKTRVGCFYCEGSTNQLVEHSVLSPDQDPSIVHRWVSFLKGNPPLKPGKIKSRTWGLNFYAFCPADLWSDASPFQAPALSDRLLLSIIWSIAEPNLPLSNRTVLNLFPYMQGPWKWNLAHRRIQPIIILEPSTTLLLNPRLNIKSNR